MSEKYGFVYIWRDRKHNRYYIGCHWGTVEDGYICSSNWMRDAYNRRPNDFKRRILKNNLSRNEMYLEEQKVFDMIKPEELRIRYYNLRLNTNTHPWHMDPDRNLSVGEKISKAKKGKKVNPCTPERAKKISESKKGKAPKISEEGMARKRAAAKPLSPEHKEAIAEGLAKFYEENESRSKGRTLTDEHKAAISAGLVGKTRSRYTQSEATRIAREKAVAAATKAKIGTKAYNNGKMEIRCKEHPGEGWVLGGLKRQKSNNV